MFEYMTAQEAAETENRKTSKCRKESEYMNKILIIEDDITINGLLRSIIEKNGYVVDNAYNGTDGLAMGLHEDYSLILLDLMLPEKTGEDIVKELRKVNETPIIVLSAKSETYNRVELLRLGADDYITKPFDIDEVLLRIQAVLRRTSGQETKDIMFHELVIKTDSKRVLINGEEIVCTATEYSILELLMKNPTRIFSKRTLYELVMGEDYLQEDNTMNVHISNLRRKIAKHTNKKYIETVYGMGYRLVK